MALQLGLLDGAVKLTKNADDESLRECLTLTRARYEAYASAIDTGESDRAVYWRIVFSILSVHSPIDATFEAYRSIRAWRARYSRVPSQDTLVKLLRHSRGVDGVVLYPNNKAEYLRAFSLAWERDKSTFTRNGATDAEWRARIQRNVKGLGLAKASFAVALSNPSTSDICCIDTHIYALFTGITPKSAIGKRAYLAIEQRIRDLASEFDLSVFACQWALWDARRGEANPHTILGTI